MLDTTRELYESFLDGIKKPSTAVVKPVVFNRLINEWGQDEWLRHNVSLEEGIELNQKQMDDLEKLNVVTDGYSSVYGGVLLQPIAPTSSWLFPYPKYSYTIVDINGANVDYPKYLRLKRIKFKINYVNNVCSLTGVSEWLRAGYFRSDQKNVFERSNYRKPADDYLYYEFIDGNIRLYTGTSSTGAAMMLEYLRYPRRIFFDELHPNDAPNPTYNPGTGSVNCEFSDQQKKEIVEVAVRLYLERIGDPRYQSYLNEEAIRQITKSN
jgi:hypothetical protein